MFKNLSIGKKLAAGFGTLILVLITVSSLNYSAFQSMSERFSDSKEAAHDKAFIIDKEVDHLKWMAALSELFLDDNLSRLSIQTDDHKCGLGTWLYSEETKRRRAEDPNIDALLLAIEEPHRQLHASAIDINNTYRALDTELESLLADRWIDHLQWVNGLSGSILDGSTFSGELDHKNCAFGKWYYSYAADDPSLQKMLEKWEGPHKLLHQSAREIVARQKSGDNPGAHRVYVQSTLPALTSLEAAFLASTEWVDTAAAYRTRAQAIFETDTRNAVAATQGKLADLRAYFDKLADSASTQADHQRASSVSWLILLSVVGTVIGLSAAWFITRAMTRPIRELVRVTEHMNGEFTDLERVVRAISENDLTNEIKESEAIRIMVGCRDEIGALCNSVNECVESKSRMANSMRRMAGNLRAMISDLSDNSTQLVSAANEISSSSEQMSRGAKDQAGQLEQVSAAVEEMTATILESSKSTSDASNAAENASGTATSGGTIVAETIQGMQRIASVVKESSESITRLAQSADEIGEIISVIDDIADQTNLLALNAAIEAARAGEQGRGFAVVADEVRKLAERTGKATGEITDMIKSVQEQTQGAVASMESGITEIDSGRELADRAGASLTEIVNMSQQVMDMISQIATAAEEQSSAAEQISRNVDHVSRITQESATGAQQSASAAEQLNRQAEQLQVMVSKFKL